MKHRLLALFLAVTLLFSLALCCHADEIDESAVPVTLEESAALLLSELDLFRGTGNGFALERAPLRTEAATMLVRLYGKEAEAEAQYRAGAIRCPFTDVPSWAAPYCAWLYANGLTKGTSPTRFGADDPCSAKDYAVFLMRVLGLRDGTDFTYAEACAAAEALGIYHDLLFGGTFTRGDMAIMTLLALKTQTKDDSVSLLEHLTDLGAVLESLSGDLQKELDVIPFSLVDGSVVLNREAWEKASTELVLTVSVADLDGGEASIREVTSETLAALVSDDGDTVTLSESGFFDYAAQLKAAYDIRNTDYRFRSYVKGITRISFLKSDYLLSASDVQKALAHSILRLSSGTVSLQRTESHAWGKNLDLSKTCVEVDIDNQRMTYIKNGKVIVSTPVVTGKLNGCQTPVGLYYSHHKVRNTTLTGDDYSVFVQYWISVIDDSIGLHDASWRSVFGKEEYVNNGSHGCVNTPTAAMQLIYQTLDDNTPVLIHGRNTWYQVGGSNSPVTKNPLH